MAKFDLFGNGKHYGTFTADNQATAKEMGGRWAAHCRMSNYDARPIDPIGEDVLKPTADEFMKYYV